MALFIIYKIFESYNKDTSKELFDLKNKHEVNGFKTRLLKSLIYDKLNTSELKKDLNLQ